jgi:hypothetical protein
LERAVERRPEYGEDSLDLAQAAAEVNIRLPLFGMLLWRSIGRRYGRSGLVWPMYCPCRSCVSAPQQAVRTRHAEPGRLLRPLHMGYSPVDDRPVAVLPTDGRCPDDSIRRLVETPADATLHDACEACGGACRALPPGRVAHDLAWPGLACRRCGSTTTAGRAPGKERARGGRRSRHARYGASSCRLGPGPRAVRSGQCTSS